MQPVQSEEEEEEEEEEVSPACMSLSETLLLCFTDQTSPDSQKRAANRHLYLFSSPRHISPHSHRAIYVSMEVCVLWRKTIGLFHSPLHPVHLCQTIPLYACWLGHDSFVVHNGSICGSLSPVLPWVAGCCCN